MPLAPRARVNHDVRFVPVGTARLTTFAQVERSPPETGLDPYRQYLPFCMRWASCKFVLNAILSRHDQPDLFFRLEEAFVNGLIPRLPVWICLPDPGGHVLDRDHRWLLGRFDEVLNYSHGIFGGSDRPGIRSL